MRMVDIIEKKRDGKELKKLKLTLLLLAIQRMKYLIIKSVL